MNTGFYDQLAPYYHLVFQNWEAGMEWQGQVLDRIISSEWGGQVSTIVDVSCGIGTQAIGLASIGYKVEASDLSPRAIERAKSEAGKRNLDIQFSVCDMRNVSTHYHNKFDLLISCDNSIPHLLTDEEILDTFREFYCCIKHGGGCLITLRDYNEIDPGNIQVIPHGERVVEGVTHILFQVWNFIDEHQYDLALYLITDDGASPPETRVFQARYYAVALTTIMHLMQEAGFENVRTLEGDFYQPVIVGTRPVNT